MTIEHSEYSTDVVPSVCLSPNLGSNVDRYTIANEPTGCVLSNDNQIQMAADDLMLNQNTYIVENSNDVVIGPVTHFHCPVTIIQNAQDGSSINSSRGSLPSSKDVNLHKENACDNHVIISKHQQKDNNGTPNKWSLWRQFKTRRKLFNIILIAITVVSFALAVSIAIIFIQDSSTDATFTTAHIDKNMSDQCPTSSDDNDDNETLPFDPEAIQMIPRRMWGARPPLSVRLLETPVKYIIVAHTVSRPCFSLETCAGILQSLQSYAVDHRSPDIGYNFLIGSDGNIYVGRDWNAINYLQNHSIAVAFIGNFSYDEFTKKMQMALKKLISTGLIWGALREDYILLSHSQTGGTMSPGMKIRCEIEKWEHYYDKDYIEIPN